MKKNNFYRILSISFVTAFLIVINISCSDEEVSASKNEIAEIYYSNSVNTKDGLQAEYRDNNGSVVYFYGTSNEERKPDSIKSIIISRPTTDTLTNIILDNKAKIKLIYYTNSDGIKYDEVNKFEYLSNDTILISIYDYNWTDKSDSLTYQFKIKDDVSTRTYRKSNKRESNNDEVTLTWEDMKEAVLDQMKSAAFAKGLAISIGLLGVALALESGGLSMIIAGALISSLTSNPNPIIASELNLDAPVSPTSQFIPNPIGTPENPTGEINCDNFYYSFNYVEVPVCETCNYCYEVDNVRYVTQQILNISGGTPPYRSDQADTIQSGMVYNGFCCRHSCIVFIGVRDVNGCWATYEE